ncbi:hypothetical protein DKG77_13815 [Flagellimonas aquimarina]|uniref:Uncharacterized protein n=1 Tax=Flagellimonas aquimarina TaxID=2201895 RepID=A0A316KUH1_9FLAO|nr:hypothetical protein [Allomuricauda koreensis]PWL37842.1 hypothetical protein DKG77_13815 [Allomuricauda koreensis]
MEKLEKHIKERLEERKISPSAGAWDRVSAQIPVKEKPNQKGWYLYAIAASFVGIVLVSIFFFKSEEPKESTIQVVEEHNRKQEEALTEEGKINFQNVELNKPGIVEKAYNNRTQEKTNDLKLQALPLQTEVAEETVKEPLQDSFLKEPNDLIAQKVNQVVAQVEFLENTNAEVTDAEIDSLLRAAQRQIITEQLFTESSSVDAMALLSEVEIELDDSFRDQIFDALKDGYSKLRTAVADRNN